MHGAVASAVHDTIVSYSVQPSIIWSWYDLHQFITDD